MNQFKLKHFFWVFVLHPNLPALKEENSIQHNQDYDWLMQHWLVESGVSELGWILKSVLPLALQGWVWAPSGV